MPNDRDSRRTITAVERAADVLALFTRTRRPALGVTEIATELGLSKAVVHRVLTSLVGRDLVVLDTDSRRYRLGPLSLALGVAYSEHLDVRTLALPSLRALSAKTDETATLSVRYGWRRVYVEQITPPREVRMTVSLGVPYPLHAGGSSKAFLAYLPRDEQERYLTEHTLEAFTDETVTDPQALRRDLAQVRARGYAVTFGERQVGAGSVAAPLFNHHGDPLAVISVCGPVERFGDEVEMAAAHLVEATRELSHQLGFPAAVR